MIDRRSYTLQHIDSMRLGTRVDRQILERSIYALGLLESLVVVGAPIVFKGGSSLMLLLDHPMRLSTDIDVVVPPGTDITAYLDSAARVFPFSRMEEQHRKGKNDIEKRHFKFFYDSPVTKREFYILLDVVFEDNHYARMVEKPIANNTIIVDEPATRIIMPTADCILGDKICAFAPHTTGIPLGIDKDLEVIKQMYDVSTLMGVLSDFQDVQITFAATAEVEIGYRGIESTPQDILNDAMESAACVAGRGRYGTEYPIYLRGIRSMANHVFGERFTAERAVRHASKVMYLSACLLAGVWPQRIDDITTYRNEFVVGSRFARLSVLKRQDPLAFAYLVETTRLLKDNENAG